MHNLDYDILAKKIVDALRDTIPNCASTDYVSLEEACVFLGLKKSSVYSKVKSGDLVRRNVKGEMSFLMSELMRFKDGMRNGVGKKIKKEKNELITHFAAQLESGKIVTELGGKYYNNELHELGDRVLLAFIKGDKDSGNKLINLNERHLNNFKFVSMSLYPVLELK